MSGDQTNRKRNSMTLRLKPHESAFKIVDVLHEGPHSKKDIMTKAGLTESQFARGLHTAPTRPTWSGS